MKPRNQRLAFISAGMLFLCVSALLTLRALRENLVFFYSPSEALERAVAPGRKIRVGGIVREGSLAYGEHNTASFEITDGAAGITVTYRGLLPNLFREGQGVIAEGTLDSHSRLQAASILAKHDENYMPREVVEALKRSGQWRGAPP